MDRVAHGEPGLVEHRPHLVDPEGDGLLGQAGIGRRPALDRVGERQGRRSRGDLGLRLRRQRKNVSRQLPPGFSTLAVSAR